MQDAEEQIMELEASSAEGISLILISFKFGYSALQSNAELRQEVQTRQNDLALQERQKDVMEKELKQTLAECEEKTGEIKTLTNQLMKTRDENTVLFGQVKDLKSTGERSNKENRLLETRFNRLQGEYQAQADVADQLAADIQKKLNELKSRDDEIGKLKQEMVSLGTVNRC